MEFVFRSCRVHWLEIESVYPLIRGQSRQRDDCDYDEDGAGEWEERNGRNRETSRNSRHAASPPAVQQIQSFLNGPLIHRGQTVSRL